MERELAPIVDEQLGDPKKRRKKKKEGELDPSNFVAKWRERRRKSAEQAEPTEIAAEQPTRLAAFGRRVGRLLGWRPRAERPIPAPETIVVPERAERPATVAEMAAVVGSFVLGRTRRMEQQAAEEVARPDALITPAAAEELTEARTGLGAALDALRATASEHGEQIAPIEQLVEETEHIAFAPPGETVEIPLRQPAAATVERVLADIPFAATELPIDQLGIPTAKPNIASPVRATVEAGLLAAAVGSELRRRSTKNKLEYTLRQQQQRIASLEQTAPAPQTTSGEQPRVTPDVIAQTVEMAKEQTRTTDEVAEDLRTSRQETAVPLLNNTPKEVSFTPEASRQQQSMEQKVQPARPTVEAAPVPAATQAEVRAAAPEVAGTAKAEQQGEAEKPATEVEETILRIERLEVRDRNQSDKDDEAGGSSKGGAAAGHTAPLSNATSSQAPSKLTMLKHYQKKLLQQAKAQPGAFLYVVVLFVTIGALIYILVTMG